MRKIMPDEVQAAVEINKIETWSPRSCSLCRMPLKYTFAAEAVTFDQNCGCTSHHTKAEPASYADVARHFNIRRPEAREQMWRAFTSSGTDSGRAQ